MARICSTVKFTCVGHRKRTKIGGGKKGCQSTDSFKHYIVQHPSKNYSLVNDLYHDADCRNPQRDKGDRIVEIDEWNLEFSRSQNMFHLLIPFLIDNVLVEMTWQEKMMILLLSSNDIQ